jgi:uncharacterized protein YkwD
MRILAIGLLVWLLPSMGAGSVEASSVADRVLQRLQAARSEAELVPLEREGRLDALAAEQAARIGRLRHDRRKRFEAKPAALLEREGLRYRTVGIHIDMNLGYRDPADGFLRSWRASRPAWSSAMERGRRQVGIATLRAADNWTVLVMLFVEPELTPAELPPPAELERAAIRAVREARRKRGLSALRVSDALTRVARGHSEEMALRGFFDHVTPEGLTVGDRVEAAGLRFKRVGENLHTNRNVEDPIAKAVESWLKSPAHRGLMLSDEYLETGIGVAIDYRGGIFFTQLFLYPDRTRR